MPEYVPNVATPAEKGNALEAAVAAIESHILRTTPGLGAPGSRPTFGR